MLSTRRIVVAGLTAFIAACTGATSDSVPSTSASRTVATVAAPAGARDLPCGDVIARPDHLQDGEASILDAVALPIAPVAEQPLQAVREDDDAIISIPIHRRCAVGDLLIRDLPPRTHDELRRRADQAGMSLQAFVAQLLERSTSMPSLGDWLRGLDELSRHDVSGAEVMRSVRDDLP